MANAKRSGRVSVARRVAFDVLRAVDAGAFASDLLVERATGLDARDAGLAAEITLGTLRRQDQLDDTIGRASGRPMDKLDREVKLAIRIGAYQLLFLDRVPAYAAVGESVELVRLARKASAAGFVNAVLRKVSKEKPRVDGDRAVPDWMFARWAVVFGEDAARGIAMASLDTPQLYQHIPQGEAPPHNAKQTGVPNTWQVQTPEPRYRIQDIGSQAVASLVEAKPGERVLDLCAAPGNKTALIRERGAWVIAADISLRRLKNVGGERVLLDATTPLPFARDFDWILVDAPCSGTGTLAHNPEIKWRLKPDDLARFAERQRAILANALVVLKPGGTLVYSTCSIEPEEDEEIARSVAPGRIEREIRRIPGRDPGDGFYAAVIR